MLILTTMDRISTFRALCGFTSVAGTAAVSHIARAYLGVEKTALVFSNNPVLLLVTVLLALEGIGRVIGWIAYRPAKPIENDDALPELTAVIPAYNEGKFIRYALSSILRSDYPKNKIRVVAVDDGSTDDTWDHIMAMKPAFDAAKVGFVPHRHMVNKGKRAGIQTGFGLGKGDIIVSLDSDSVLERRTLRNLVAPLIRDPTVGGVAGYLSALNVGKGDHQTVPRLLDVLYDLSGNIPRAAQAQAGNSVTILPGALSAFRTEAVMPLLPRLNSSLFRGKPLRHGEDIELTLGLLQTGWGTTYQSNAVVHTTAPNTSERAFLMYTRWERSSYVYLAMGFFKLAVASVMTRLSDWFLSNTTRTSGVSWESYTSVLQEPKGATKPRVVSRAGKNEDGAPTVLQLVGDLYLLLNLVCTAISNLLLPIACITQVRTIYLYPEAVSTLFIIVVVSSAFRNLLFVADARVEGLDEETSELHIYSDIITGSKCSCDSGESDTDSDSGYDSASEASYCQHTEKPEVYSGEKITVYSRKDRLRWRFQYGGLASVFHMTYISWTSIFALCSLESQSWLTR